MVRRNSRLGTALARSRLALFLILPGLALFSSAWFTLPHAIGHAESEPVQSGEVRSETETTSGLQRVIFTTRRGKIFINLPQDLRPGETSSGSIFLEPSGKTDAERAAGNEELGVYVVEIAGQKIPASKREFELKLTDRAPGMPLNDDIVGVSLRDKKGKEVARGELKVSLQVTEPATGFRLPTVQLGDMIQVGCPCDGVMADSDYVKVGGQTSLSIAESPRARWAFNINPAKGPTEIEISERGQVINGKTAVLGIKLSALKTGLQRGERTTLTVDVSGLEGLKEPVPLRLENKTPDVLTMEPSNVQDLEIRPTEIQPGGQYTTKRTLTGIRVGAFRIEGTVVRKDEPVAFVRIESDQERVRLRDSLIQKIKDLDLPRPPPPQITVLSPAIGSLVKESQPTFRWTLSGLPGEVQRVFYSIRIVEIQPEQGLRDALLNNPPAFERNNLTDNTFQLPREGGLTNGKIYAWRVAAFGPGGVELSRSSGSFLGVGSWPPWSFCWLVNLGPIDYCVNQSSGVTVAFFVYFGGGGSISWTLTPQNIGDSPVTGSSPTITIPANLLPTTPGPHTYTLTVTRGNCTRTTTITINAFPAAAVGGAAVVAPTQICDGQTAVLDVQGESGNVGQWEYSDNNGPWLNATSAFFIAGAPANTNQMQPTSCTAPNWYTDRRFRAVVYTSNATNAPSCSTTYSTPTTLRIYCKPRAGVVTASTTRICKYANNPPITLTMTGTIVGNISWNSSSGPIAGSQNTVTVPAPTTTTTYWATVTTGGSCPSVTSNPVTVIVDNQPFCTSANTALTVDNNLVCPGDAATLTLNNCSGIVTWQQGPSSSGPWTTISSGNSVQNTTDLFSTTWWRAIISGPPGGTCPPIISNVVVINVKGPPVPPVVATPGPVCFGNSATLTTSPPPSGVTYQWFHDDVPIACGGGATCTFPAEPGNYWVEASNGCETVRSNFVTLPVDVITVGLNAPCCGTGLPITLSATANSSLSGPITNPALFVWYQGGVQIGTGTSITVNPLTTTPYCVKVSSPTTPNCSAQLCTTITVCP